MRFRLSVSAPLVSAAALVLAAACGGADSGTTQTPSPTPGVTRTAPVPSPTSGGGRSTPTPSADRIVVPAPIDDLEMIIRESAPPQYAVRILSGLPSGCARFHEARITGRSGTTITIEVTNTMPSDQTIACTAIYGTHESIIELGTDFTPRTEYLVRVNDKELRFTAQ